MEACLLLAGVFWDGGTLWGLTYKAVVENKHFLRVQLAVAIGVNTQRLDRAVEITEPYKIIA